MKYGVFAVVCIGFAAHMVQGNGEEEASLIQMRSGSSSTDEGLADDDYYSWYDNNPRRRNTRRRAPVVVSSAPDCEIWKSSQASGTADAYVKGDKAYKNGNVGAVFTNDGRGWKGSQLWINGADASADGNQAWKGPHKIGNPDYIMEKFSHEEGFKICKGFFCGGNGWNGVLKGKKCGANALMAYYLLFEK